MQDSEFEIRKIKANYVRGELKDYYEIELWDKTDDCMRFLKIECIWLHKELLDAINKMNIERIRDYDKIN